LARKRVTLTRKRAILAQNEKIKQSANNLKSKAGSQYLIIYCLMTDIYNHKNILEICIEKNAENAFL
jgi:hypothetical protein